MATRRHFKELVDVPRLQELTDELYRATLIPSAIITMEGEILTGSGWQRICTEFHRQHPKTELDCVDSDTTIRKGLDEGEPYVIYRCPRGLVDASSPVIIEGQHVANVFAGQLFMLPPDEKQEAFFRQTARDYGFDEEAYMEAFREIPVLPEERFRPALSFLARFAHLIADIGLARLRELEALEEVRKSEVNYRTMLDSFSDMIHVVDSECRIKTFNRRFEKEAHRLGFSEISPDQNLFERFPFLSDAVKEEYRRVFATGEILVSEETHRFGQEEITTETRKIPILNDGTVGRVMTVIRDVTQYKRARKNYKDLFDKMLDGFAVHEIICDENNLPIDYRFLAVNSAFEKMTGLAADRVIGKRALETLPGLESSWIERYGKVALTGEPQRFENYVHEIGRHYEVVAFRPEPYQFATIFQDITDRKRAERENQKAERLESVGVLAGGIAHDFNNILTSLLGSIQLARMDMTLGTETERMLAESEKACFRAADLTKQLLTFAKGGAPIKKIASINQVIMETVNFALRGSNVKADFRLPENVWVAEIDTGQISQVLNNLTLNADQAMPTGGVIRISTENLLLDEKNRDGMPLGDGRYVKVSISDQGPGIDGAHLAKIFDPYFTTKRTGSGLGLATSYSILRQHNGHILCRSTPGEGSTFEFFLPASLIDPNVAEKAKGGLRTGEGRILLMDDDVQLRETARAMFKRLGYRIDFAAEGKEAVGLYRKAQEIGDPYSAVILDLTVPGGMGGKSAIELLREIDPKIKAIVASGYSNDPILADPSGVGFLGVLPKPFSIEALGEALEEVLKG